jgi:hypothetical protein
MKKMFILSLLILSIFAVARLSGAEAQDAAFIEAPNTDFSFLAVPGIVRSPSAPECFDFQDFIRRESGLKAKQGTFVERLPFDLVRYYLLLYMIGSKDLKEGVSNLVKLINTLDPERDVRFAIDWSDELERRSGVHSWIILLYIFRASGPNGSLLQKVRKACDWCKAEGRPVIRAVHFERAARAESIDWTLLEAMLLMDPSVISPATMKYLLFASQGAPKSFLDVILSNNELRACYGEAYSDRTLPWSN